MTITEINKSQLAKSAEEFRELANSSAEWVVRSAEDLTQLRSSDQKTILSRIPRTEFDSFVSSLKFSNGALASACYKPLMSTLTLSEIFEVFEYFGMDREYTVRTLEYECTGGGCKFDFWSLCTGSCK
ncbi:hypothetical protein [Streptomyces sp. MN13]